jgi:hypothetical protein
MIAMFAMAGILGVPNAKISSGHIGFSSVYSFVPVFCILLFGVPGLGLAETLFQFVSDNLDDWLLVSAVLIGGPAPPAPVLAEAKGEAKG